MSGEEQKTSSPRKRSDVQRNEKAVLTAAAEAFVAAGVDAPVRDIARRAGVGVATIYRHFPTRADLIAAVYRHQIEACAEAGPALLQGNDSPLAALRDWIDLFIDFLVTKHGLARALQPESTAFETMHALFLDRLVPVCAQLLDAAVDADEAIPGHGAYEVMRAVGNLCVGAEADPEYDARSMAHLLISGLRPRDEVSPADPG